MKYAIVTGGTKGIGKAAVIELLKRDYFVTTNYASDTQTANSALEEFLKISPNIEVLQANQSDNKDFNKFIEYCKDNLPTVDCIVCNAGMTLRKPFVQISNDEWETVMRVSVNSHVYLVRDLFKQIPQNSRIIFIGSMLGILPHATSLPYGVAKSAVHALAKNLVKEFEGTNTTVNAIAPGFVETEWQKNKPEEIRQNIYRKTAIKRFAEVSEIASAIGFCLDNGFINGSVIEIDGGYSFK
jgi:3-oxoacyl-[acyl-carrier protein] reductase